MKCTKCGTTRELFYKQRTCPVCVPPPPEPLHDKTPLLHHVLRTYANHYMHYDPRYFDKYLLVFSYEYPHQALNYNNMYVDNDYTDVIERLRSWNT